MIVRKTSLRDMNHWEHEHIIMVSYGHDNQWTNVTDRFWQIYASHYDVQLNSSTLTINNRCFGMRPTDLTNQLVIETMEGGEYTFREDSEVTLRYRYVTVLKHHVREIKEVTYGYGSNFNDITQRAIELMRSRQRYIFISNQLSGCDPCPNRLKTMTIIFRNGKTITVDEYSLLIIL